MILVTGVNLDIAWVAICRKGGPSYEAPIILLSLLLPQSYDAMLNFKANLAQIYAINSNPNISFWSVPQSITIHAFKSS